MEKEMSKSRTLELTREYLKQPNYSTFCPLWIVKTKISTRVFLLESEAKEFIGNDPDLSVEIISTERGSLLHRVLRDFIEPKTFDEKQQYLNVLM